MNPEQPRLNVLSLFSGIGGLELGLERAGMHVVGQVEKDPYCLRVLAKHWPEVARHDDVRTAVDWWTGEPRPRVDVVCGGFPCQDISSAGKRVGITGAKSGLWSYMADTVRVLRPSYVVMENVSAILVRGLDVVASDLHEIGYDLQWDCVPAAAVGAPHRRDRWWGIAYPHSQQLRLEPVAIGGCGGASESSVDGGAESLADTHSIGRQPRAGQLEVPTIRVEGDGESCGSRPAVADTERQGLQRFPWSSVRLSLAAKAGKSPGGQWFAEPDVGRVAHGVPKRVDRLRALGNAVVPQAAEHIGRLLVEFDRERAA